MKKQNTDKILQQIAKKHGVSVEEVRREIALTLAIGQSSLDPKTHALWSAVSRKGDKPTLEEAIAYFAKMVKGKL